MASRIEHRRQPKRNIRWYAFAAVVVLTGCSSARVLMPTPNVYVEADYNSYATIAPELKSTEVPLFYITDRIPEKDEAGKLHYGHGRSASVAFGKTIVDLGAEISWDDLLEASQNQRRLKPVKLTLRDVNEIARTPATPLPYKEVNGRIIEEPSLLAQRTEAHSMFRRAIVEQLKLTPRNEVFIYVHGYHNQFEDAAFAMAELWHFVGRVGVPIVYSWPAGYPGLFGYTYDRESSEFTVYHLRTALRAIASFPEVKKIHLIAHSRGTDIAVAAVRELTIAARAAGVDPRKKFKIHNLILAAPDIDFQVAATRVVSDQIGLSTNRFTVYTSPDDGAIGISTKLFASPRGRLGSFGVDGLSDSTKAILDYSASNVALVLYTDTADTIKDRHTHAYFRNSPSVASDVVLTLRDDLDPGTPGRPLEPVGPHLWAVPSGYPRQ